MRKEVQRNDSQSGGTCESIELDEDSSLTATGSTALAETGAGAGAGGKGGKVSTYVKGISERGRV